MMKFNRDRGFTLIELLVVIAIIGILSSVVLASLNSARKKGRDARRIADVKQIQLALELYYDANGAYPATLSTSTLVTPGYISSLPADPSNSQVYAYQPYGATASAATCSSYHLGSDLESVGHTALASDADVLAVPTGYVVCTATGAPATDFSGDDGGKCSSTNVGVTCYDVKS